jgi:hypothetical protein
MESINTLDLEPWEVPVAEIERRMRDLFQICKLGAALKHAKWLGPVVTPSSILGEDSTPVASQASGGFTTETRRHEDK